MSNENDNDIQPLVIRIDPQRPDRTEVLWRGCVVGFLRHLMLSQSDAGPVMVTIAPYDPEALMRRENLPPLMRERLEGYEATLREMEAHGVLVAQCPKEEGK